MLALLIQKKPDPGNKSRHLDDKVNGRRNLKATRAGKRKHKPERIGAGCDGS
jgi:hypothetical protein